MEMSGTDPHNILGSRGPILSSGMAEHDEPPEDDTCYIILSNLFISQSSPKKCFDVLQGHSVNSTPVTVSLRLCAGSPGAKPLQIPVC